MGADAKIDLEKVRFNSSFRFPSFSFSPPWLVSNSFYRYLSMLQDPLLESDFMFLCPPSVSSFPNNPERFSSAPPVPPSSYVFYLVYKNPFSVPFLLPLLSLKFLLLPECQPRTDNTCPLAERHRDQQAPSARIPDRHREDPGARTAHAGTGRRCCADRDWSSLPRAGPAGWVRRRRVRGSWGRREG